MAPTKELDLPFDLSAGNGERKQTRGALEHVEIKRFKTEV